jgi:hypothetical protein
MTSRISSGLAALTALADSAMSAIGLGSGPIAKSSPVPAPRGMKFYAGGHRKSGNGWRMKRSEVLRDWMLGKAQQPNRHYNLVERYRQRHTHMLTSTMTDSNVHGAHMNCHRRRRLLEAAVNPMVDAKTTRQVRRAAAQ